MIQKLLKLGSKFGVIAIVGLMYSMQIQAHGGLWLAEDMCKLTIGPYTMHFHGLSA